MLRAWRLTASCFVLLATAALAAACSSSSEDRKPHGLSAGGSGAQGSGTGGSAAGGTTGGTTGGASGSSGSGTGGSITVTGGSAGSAQSGAGAPDGDCGSDEYAAELVPLDIYVMLDSSGSMLDEANGSTKWEAVQSALVSFLGDPQSAGIGIGLQFFPLADPDAPASCDSNAACGTHGPCLQRYCAGAGPGFYFCGEDSDCVADDMDYGPCAPLTYCWSLLTMDNPVPTLCHDDTECGTADDCVGFNECSLNTDYGCKEPGQMCVTSTGENFGTCTRFDPISACAHTTDCRSATYATPAAEIAQLPGASAALSDVILAKEPEGDTPTSPALAGAIAHARTWAMSHPDHKVVVLLATDGLPTECLADPTSDGIAEVAGVATDGVSGSPEIPTFVIGVFSPEDVQVGADTNLDRIAVAGGQDAAIIVDTNGNVEQDFLDALDEVRGAHLSCEYKIPTPTGGAVVYDHVNVTFRPSAGANAETLYYVPTEADCDPVTGGWHYDVEPGTGTPTTIIACPASCTTFQSSTDGSVSISLGCATVVK